MIVEKNYAATLDIRDPEEYCSRPEEYAMAFLRRRYVGKNLRGAQVLEVLEILRRSDCVMRDSDLSAEANVHLEFRARVVVLGQWDIVTGVRVANMGSQMIVGRSEVEGVVVVNVVPSAEAETLRVDQLVSVRIIRVQFSPDQAQATAVARVLTCDRTAPVFALEADLDGEDARALAPLAAQARDLLAARAALMAARRDDVLFFEQLLYSYARSGAEGQTVETAGPEPAAAWEGPAGQPLAGGAAANLLEIVAGALAEGRAAVRGTWSRDLALHRSSPLAVRVPPGQAPPARWAKARAESPRVAFADMLTTVSNFLKAVNEMTALYGTRELVDSHKNVWLAMRNAQLPPP